MPKTRVLIVDDSELIRKLLTSVIASEPDLEVVGEAADPYEARERIKQLNPDVVTLDIEMPKMDGLEFLEKIMTMRPTPVVMVSTLTQAGAPQAIRALEIGAIDYVGKPLGSEGFDRLRGELPAKIRLAAATNLRGRVVAPSASRVVARAPEASAIRLIAIGSSTGGVEALREIFLRLPAGLPPIVIAQHMPRAFTAPFVARLGSLSGLPVSEARDGLPLERGHAYVAPGGLQTRVMAGRTGLIARCTDDVPVSGHKPSVDALFASAAGLKNAAIGVILTGMGRDGAEGLLQMRQAGARTLGQSAESCVVYGMPRAARELGAVEEDHAVGELARHIVERCV